MYIKPCVGQNAAKTRFSEGQKYEPWFWFWFAPKHRWFVKEPEPHHLPVVCFWFWFVKKYRWFVDEPEPWFWFASSSTALS